MKLIKAVILCGRGFFIGCAALTASPSRR